MFLDRIREMVSFELGRGIEKDVFRLVTSVGQRKQKILSPHEESNLTLSKLLFRPRSMQDACHMKFEIDLAHCGVSSTPFSSRSIYFTTLTC